MGWIFRPFDLVTRGIWLLGSCPRSDGAVPDYPSVGSCVVSGVYYPGILFHHVFLQKLDGKDPLFGYITFSFILAYVRCPSSTCRVDLSRTGICPISLILKLLEMILKA